MADIKTKSVIKGTVKTLDRSAIAAERARSAYIRTKDGATNSVSAPEGSAEEYGADRLQGSAERFTEEAAYRFKKKGQSGFRDVQKNTDKVKQNIQKIKELGKDQPKKAAQKAAKSAADTTARTAGNASEVAGKGSIKSAQSAGKGTIKTARSAGKGTVKTAHKSVKTAEKSGKVAVKTTKQAAKTAKVTAKATARTAQRAAQAARAVARATVAAVKIAVKATVAAVKAAIAATKALIAAIAAGGWIAVLVIIIICLIGLIVGSCFGIFFSGEDTGGQPMTAVVREINDDYQAQIDTTKANLTYDVLEMSGSRAVWKEVLAVYAVKTTTDPDNPQDVASMDDGKKSLLNEIFWQMNAITSRTETKTETVITETDDGHGNIVETETTVTRTYLYITVSHKTAEEMADVYGFTADQRKQLAELLADENNSLWTAVLYGITGTDDQIVAVALSQIGNEGGDPYWSWYGFDSRVDWCACFVSWCANECGYIDAGVIPKYAGCVWGVQWFQDRGQWLDNGAEPSPGMIIFFDWDEEDVGQDGESDHTGIVEKVENGRVYTVEGNSGDSCREKSYPLGYYEILGYGAPAY